MRKRYSATFKADAVKELMKEEKTINQLAAELGVHPTQRKEWKKVALQGLPELFSREGKASYHTKLLYKIIRCTSTYTNKTRARDQY